VHTTLSPEHARVDSIGFVTCGRPAALRRALESFGRNVREHGGACRLVVADDSRARADGRVNEATLDEVGRRFGLPTTYVGRAAKARLVSALARETSLPAELVEFAVYGDGSFANTAGANRNALLLTCAGTAFVSSDDDMVARACAWPSAQGTAAPRVWSAPEDPCGFRFYASRAQALDADRAREVDLVGTYEAGLGREVRDRTLPPEARLVACFLGIHGDSGFESPAALLYATNAETRAHMTESAERHRTAMSSRELLRVVDRPTVARPLPFFGGAMALDARALLPPFAPVLRNEDGLFGRTLGVMDPTAFCLHQPIALLHAPEPRGPYAVSPVQAARTSRFCELVLAALMTFPVSAATRGAADRLRAMGARLLALGAASPAAFAVESRALLHRVASAKVSRLRSLLDGSRHAPAHWVADTLAYERALREAIASGSIFLVSELGSEIEVANTRARGLLGKLGALYQAWPVLFDAAASIARSEGPGGEAVAG
jgi:hypothetical protein